MGRQLLFPSRVPPEPFWRHAAVGMLNQELRCHRVICFLMSLELLGGGSTQWEMCGSRAVPRQRKPRLLNAVGDLDVIRLSEEEEDACTRTSVSSSAMNSVESPIQSYGAVETAVPFLGCVVPGSPPLCSLVLGSCAWEQMDLGFVLVIWLNDQWGKLRPILLISPETEGQFNL